MTTKINKSHLLLLKMIEKNGNKNCADCGVEGTRWASWNFGIFLCIRCAGIHRNLGVHISKVKSVDLDSWTTEQLQAMETMGNQRSQEIFEAALPQNFARPQTNYAIEEFIRAKYQYKRYCLDTSKSETISTPKSTPVNPSDAKPRSNKSINNTEKDLFEPQTKVVDSDDSLSDPDYLIELKDKQKNKSSSKINPEINLINFNCSNLPNSDNHNIDYGANSNKSDQKLNILALYNRPNANGGYQSGFTHQSTDSFSSHHKSYGSSVDNQYNTTTSIPISNQNSYLKQIQEKLTSLKDNLTSKFRPYEQTNSSSYQSNVSFNQNNNNISTGDTANQNGGHTLSPDLWR